MKQLNSANLLLNGAFKYWYSGTSSVPDGWTLSGNGSVARESTEVPDNFSYSAKITSDSDGNWLRNSFSADSWWYSQFEDKTVTFSCWVHADDASTARLQIWQSSDSSNGTYSDYHTGGGDWELLTVSYTFPSGTNPTNAIFRIKNEGDTKIIYATGAMLVEGSSAFAYTEHKEDIKYNSDLHRWDSGIIDTPNQSGCRVYSTGGDQSIPHATYTKVEFNGEDYDTQNEFDSSTDYQFTATKAGKYLIHSNLQIDRPGTNNRFWIAITVNGSHVAKRIIQASTDDVLINNILDIQNLSAGDYVGIEAYQDSGSSQGIVKSSRVSYLTISKIQ